MLSVSLTRRVHFCAAHRYRRPEWSDAENAAAFGPCARPSFHGHNYACDVTVTGPVDDTTGMLVNLDHLDAVLQQTVVDPLDHRNLNLDVPDFGDGRVIPTCENLARWIFTRVASALGPGVQLTDVRVAEDDRLSVTVRAAR